MGLISLLATTLLIDEVTKNMNSEETERQRRIQAARERDEDRLRRKIRILKEEFGEDAIKKIKF